MSKNEKTSEWGSVSGNYFIKKAVLDKTYIVCRMILLFGLCFLILQPILDKISVSFMGQHDLYDSTVIIIPRNFTLDNYRLANQLMGFWSSLLETFIIVIVSAALQVSACTLAGYSFARFKFPLKNFWFMCVMLIIIVPPQTIMSSLYLNFRFFNVGFTKINLLNTVFGLWLLSVTGMGLKTGLYIFMLRQYFRGVPKELEEAAWVDGCGRFKTFVRIIIPDAMPMITSCFLFSFVWQWTDSFYATLFLNSYRMLAKGLGGLAERYSQWYASVNVATGTGGVSAFAPVAQTQMMIATGMLMCLAPLILLYLVAQKAFVESLSQTGIKM